MILPFSKKLLSYTVKAAHFKQTYDSVIEGVLDSGNFTPDTNLFDQDVGALCVMEYVTPEGSDLLLSLVQKGVTFSGTSECEKFYFRYIYCQHYLFECPLLVFAKAQRAADNSLTASEAIVIELYPDRFQVNVYGNDFNDLNEICQFVADHLGVPQLNDEVWLVQSKIEYRHSDRYVNGLSWNSGIEKFMASWTDAELFRQVASAISRGSYVYDLDLDAAHFYDEFVFPMSEYARSKYGFGFEDRRSDIAARILYRRESSRQSFMELLDRVRLMEFWRHNLQATSNHLCNL